MKVPQESFLVPIGYGLAHFAEATTRMTWPNAAGAAPLALI